MEEILIDRRCQIKKKGFFKNWIDSFLKYDENHLFLNINQKDHKFSFENIVIDNIKKSRGLFDLYYKNKFQMTIKMKSEENFKLTLKKLEEFIDRCQQKGNKTIIQINRKEDSSKIEIKFNHQNSGKKSEIKK